MKQSSLDTLRLEIDAIDDKIHKLLMSRAELVTEIGNLKQRAGEMGFSLRPAREAAIMRRLVAKHQGAFPASALVKIWRELLSGTVKVQTPFSVAVCNGKDPILHHSLVRDQFSGAPVRNFPRPDDAIRNVVKGDAMVAVVPVPSQKSAESWWADLAFGEYQSLKIVGRLPFLKAGTPNLGEAFSIASVRPEPSGEDITLCVIECDSQKLSYSLIDQLPSFQCIAQSKLTKKKSEEGRPTIALLSAEGFMDEPDKLLSDLRGSLGTNLTRAAIIGSYPVQLTPNDLTEI